MESHDQNDVDFFMSIPAMAGVLNPIPESDTPTAGAGWWRLWSNCGDVPSEESCSIDVVA